ncbi:glycosyltransferase [Myroides marinus]|uniref:glycosyltransferase n=1 Tax=Myroides marinus TaxID=703342 RepID=UPI002575D475|nr:glycosyltransferase [Myroides marinus]MDM1376773.1 glycosyltransferase [Myroides marinus]
MKKKIIAMDISTSGKGGGPYTSTMNLINSPLKEKYDFRLFEYNTQLGRFISFKRIKAIMNQLRIIKPNIVHFTGLQLSGFHIAIACKLLGQKNTIVVIHGSSSESMEFSKIQRIVLFIVEFLTLLLTHKFYGVSQYSSRLSITRSFSRKNIGHIYNLPCRNLENIEVYKREMFGFNSDDIIIVSVARINKEKGYHILEDSILKMPLDKNIKFLIIGDGAYKKEMELNLKSKVESENVVFLGHREDVMNILPFCDIFVLPTLHETLSIALLEASVCGLPLIASNVGGIPEIIEDNINGFLVPPSSSQSIVDSILVLSEDKELRKSMGEKAQQKVETEFSESKIINQVDDLYSSF